MVMYEMLILMRVVIWYPSIIGNTISHRLLFRRGETAGRSNMNDLKEGSNKGLAFGRNPGGA